MSIEENKAVVLRWFAELDRGNLDIVDELIADEYVDHNPALPNLPPGREGVRQYVRILKAAFPDAHHTVEDVIAEGDKVMTRVTARGTFLGQAIDQALDLRKQIVGTEILGTHRHVGHPVVQNVRLNMAEIA